MSDKTWSGYTGECCPDVFNMAAKPVQPAVSKPGHLSLEQVDEYFTKGVVMVDDYFTEEELDPIKDAIVEEVDKLANMLYEARKIPELFADLGFFERLTAVNKAYPGANIILHKTSFVPKAIRDLWSGEKLCNAMEQLIGPDIGGNPVWNLRTKTPQDEATTVPWHQDCAYLSNDAYNVHVATAWIPLLDTNVENGCMQFAKEGHKSGKIAMHQCCDGDTHYVMLEPETMADQLGVDLEKDLEVMPVKFGGVIFFNNCIPHRSLNNLSEKVRWSIDLRWQDPSKPWGFYGLTEGISFRKKEDPDWRPTEPDWDLYLNSNAPSEEATEAPQPEKVEKKKVYNLDTTIVGPWMKKWEISHQNKHTAGIADFSYARWKSSWNTD